jgi:regulatory subunit for Cdc7p protein kinase
MGIKVWGLEKLQRMLTTMFNAETGEAPMAPLNSRNASTTQTKAGQQAHLGQMLQKEKEYGQTSMDWATDMAPFRGYFIYVHDMDELTKPTIVRDYSKPAVKEQGKWPQLRVTSAGRCPFLDDPNARYERAAAATAQAEKAPRTRAAAARERTPAAGEDAALAENNNLAQRRQRSVSVQAEDKKPSMDPPKTIPVRGTSTDNLPLFGSAQASLRQHPRFAGGEPVASGLQPSNVTSAIRSQMISSTAAAPGGKAGANKELNRLQRQVLQRNNSANPYLNNDLRGAINNAGARGQKRKATDPLAGINEDDETSEAPASKPTRTQTAPVVRKKKVVEKEMKPGYCENCRAKFQDFDEVCLLSLACLQVNANMMMQHVLSRTHRKFALDDANWKELDDLLSVLGRPLKDE